MNKTRILPEVGKRYISRKTDVVVMVTQISAHYTGETFVYFLSTGRPDIHEFRYDLDSFWKNYMVMEGKDD